MTNEEFSNGFDTLVSSYRRFKDFDKQETFDSLEFDEYEKSFYLTKAQEELVTAYYSGKNMYGDYFELTEEMRRLLDSLVKTVKYSSSISPGIQKVSETSKMYQLPDNLAYVIMEQVIYQDNTLGCGDGFRANVQPVRHDEYNKIKENPFRGPTKYKALRLDCGDNIVEIISKYNIKEYLVRYVEMPSPIILEDLPNDLTIDGQAQAMECQLNPLLHETILERAVLMALRAKGINTGK